MTRPVCVRAAVVALAAVGASAFASSTASAIPYPLSFTQAKQAALARANREAGPHRPARIRGYFRTGPRRFQFNTHWTWVVPDGCHACGHSDSPPWTSWDLPAQAECLFDVYVTRSKTTGKIVAEPAAKWCYTHATPLTQP